MSRLVSSLVYNLSGQMVARLFSFAINMYLFRVVDTATIGLVNVRLMLLYDTILFLTREPLRKAPILKDRLQPFVNLCWMSPLISLGIIGVVTPLWLAASSTPLSLSVVGAFAASAWIETLAEPFCVISLRFSLHKHFALSQGLLILLKRIVVLFFIISGSEIDHLSLFCASQIIAAIAFVAFHYIAFAKYAREKHEELAAFTSYSAFFPRFSEGFDEGSPKAVASLLAHSVLKQLLTDGSAFVMTFTKLLSLEQQAVYDAIERLGSLACRMILAPLEESSFAYFSNALQAAKSSVFGKNTDSHDALITDFRAMLHDLIVSGLVVSVFGVPYSGVAVSIYGGDMLVKGGGARLLAAYAVYVAITAINGVTECFAFATMDSREVMSHGGFLFASAVFHLSLSYGLCTAIGPVGFILANVLNMMLRIGYSWRHTSRYLGCKTPSIFSLLPSGSTVVLMMFALAGGGFSNLLFFSTPGLSHALAHLAVGGVLFIILGVHVFQTEQLFVHFIKGAKAD